MFYGVVHVADGATFWMSQRLPAARVQEAIALPAMMLLQTADSRCRSTSCRNGALTMRWPMRRSVRFPRCNVLWHRPLCGVCAIRPCWCAGVLHSDGLVKALRDIDRSVPGALHKSSGVSAVKQGTQGWKPRQMRHGQSPCQNLRAVFSNSVHTVAFM